MSKNSHYLIMFYVLCITQEEYILFIGWLIGLWCLTPLLTKYFSYIVVVSFICGGNRNARRKPSTCRKSL